MNRTLPILMFAVLCGCARSPAPQVALPAAPHSPGMIDLDPRMQEVSIDASSGLWFRNRQVSPEELRDRMRSRLEELDNPPVAIRADAGLSVRTVRETIDLLDSLGVRRQTFMVLREPPDRESVIDFVTTGPEVPDFVVVEMKGDSITLNGRAVDRDKLGQLLTRLAAYSITIPIVVVPDPESILQRCIDVLDTCERAGFVSIHFVKESPITVLPDEENAQQAESTVPVKAAPSASSTVR